MFEAGHVSRQNLLFCRTKSVLACEREKEIEKEAYRKKKRKQREKKQY